jgi:hypothetical protein
MASPRGRLARRCNEGSHGGAELGTDNGRSLGWRRGGGGGSRLGGAQRLADTQGVCGARPDED